jgi:hypothetical protein
MRHAPFTPAFSEQWAGPFPPVWECLCGYSEYITPDADRAERREADHRAACEVALRARGLRQEPAGRGGRPVKRKLPRAPLPKKTGGPHRTRRNEPARKAKHKGRKDADG